jgi:uncharacterized protein
MRKMNSKNSQKSQQFQTIVTPKGFEPPTNRTGICHSIQLNYGANFCKDTNFKICTCSHYFCTFQTILLNKISIFETINITNMITKEQIDEFYGQPLIAMIGVSRNMKKFGYVAYNELKKKGYKVVPVNSNADTIDDAVCYRSIDVLPAEVTGAVVLTHKKETLAIVQQLINKGIRQIWIQQGSQTNESIDLAKTNYANVISGKCIIMFAEPAEGMHKFHRSILKLFGRLPK